MVHNGTQMLCVAVVAGPLLYGKERADCIGFWLLLSLSLILGIFVLRSQAEQFTMSEHRQFELCASLSLQNCSGQMPPPP